MKRILVLAGFAVLASSAAFAQAPAPADRQAPLTTRFGHDFNVSVQHYNYTEPLGDETDVIMHAPKVGAEYTGTFALTRTGRWFLQLNVRGTGFITNYDGACRPWQIEPSNASANGYRLTLGASSPCSESGDPDGYIEGRTLVGRDLAGRRVGLSPFAGIGLRHLSNGTTGNFNFRTDEYLYVPVGLTLRTRAAGRALGITVEYDHLVRGWQKTRESLLPTGRVPATQTAPEFLIGDYSDLSFDQHHGWALRASAAYQLSHRWSIEPYYTRWRVGDSPISSGSVAYSVNSIVVRQTLNAYEPLNFTNEVGVKIGFHLGGR